MDVSWCAGVIGILNVLVEGTRLRVCSSRDCRRVPIRCFNAVAGPAADCGVAMQEVATEGQRSIRAARSFAARDLSRVRRVLIRFFCEKPTRFSVLISCEPRQSGKSAWDDFGLRIPSTSLFFPFV